MSQNLQAILFDFDGVIVEAVSIKTDAFRRLFEPWVDHCEAIVAYHLANGGISRYEKFRYFYREILREPFTEEDIAALGERFSQYVFDTMLACPMVAGVEEFLDSYAGHLPCYIVSGTPEAELRAIVEARGLNRSFRGVFGSPAEKAAIIDRILKAGAYPPDSVLFVGDSMTDWEAAQATGVPFVGRVTPDTNPFEGLAVEASIEDLFGLARLVAHRLAAVEETGRA